MVKVQNIYKLTDSGREFKYSILMMFTVCPPTFGLYLIIENISKFSRKNIEIIWSYRFLPHFFFDESQEA